MENTQSRRESLGGLLLLGIAALAMILVNSPLAGAFEAALAWPLPLTRLPLHAAIADGLMVVFFFTVGLEIKREALAGNLADTATRRLPIMAAAMGMAVPALVFGLVQALPGVGQLVLLRGWAVPAATDIAFALGVLGLLGRRVPAELRLFLLTLAVVDDLGAVVIIALGYTAHIALAWGAAALAVWLCMLALGRLGCRRAWPFVAGTVLLWFCVLQSGLHPTVAGVAGALCVPLGLSRAGHSPLLRLEHRLAPISAYGVVPLFALAEAGLRLDPASLAVALGHGGWRLALGAGLGLALGKPLGVAGAIVLARRLGMTGVPPSARGLRLLGLGLLAGIGFTMSLFIATLAFAGDTVAQEAARLGIVAGSSLAGLSGAAALWWAGRRAA